MDHDVAHEAALARVLAGEAQEDSELLRCERCRSELQQARKAAALARAALDLERSVIEEARRTAGDAERNDLRNLLERGRRQERRQRSLRRALGLVVACAAGLLLWLALRPSVPATTPQSRGEVLLGGTLACRVELVAGRYDVFAWDSIGASAVEYRLRLRHSEAGLAGAEIASHSLSEPYWRPTPEEERGLPEELVMEVEAYGVQGDLLGAGWRLASRR
ncbi:MAG: hypothetical protein ABL998_10995 [Planctomycetota bacterium]